MHIKYLQLLIIIWMLYFVTVFYIYCAINICIVFVAVFYLCHSATVSYVNY